MTDIQKLTKGILSNAAELDVLSDTMEKTIKLMQTQAGLIQSHMEETIELKKRLDQLEVENT